jgi:phosphotransacetylase
MKRLLAALITGTVLTLPYAAFAGPDESQKILIQRAMEAKKKLSAAQAASGAGRHEAMQEHMKLMQEMMAQMHKAKPRAGMSHEQMREWMDEHMKLMGTMMEQMEGHHKMMRGMGRK